MQGRRCRDSGAGTAATGPAALTGRAMTEIVAAIDALVSRTVAYSSSPRSHIPASIGDGLSASGFSARPRVRRGVGSFPAPTTS